MTSLTDVTIDVSANSPEVRSHFVRIEDRRSAGLCVCGVELVVRDVGCPPETSDATIRLGRADVRLLDPGRLELRCEDLLPDCFCLLAIFYPLVWYHGQAPRC